MINNPYEVAEILNRMKPGEWITFDRFVLNNIGGTDSILPFGRSGWEIVMDNVIGSNTPDWSFWTDPMTGSITCKKAYRDIRPATRHPHTTAEDAMAPLAVLLLRNGSVNVQGLADALARKGTPAQAAKIADLLQAATQANMRKAK